MLKKILIASMLILSMGSASAAEMKIGVIDMQYVLSKAPQVKTLNEKVQDMFKDRYESLTALRKKGVELQEKMKRDEMTLTNAEKRKISRDLAVLDNDFKTKQAFLQEDIKIANNQEQYKLLQIIRKAIAKVVADEKFDLIIKGEVAEHVNPAYNISDKVIAIISNPAG